MMESILLLEYRGRNLRVILQKSGGMDTLHSTEPENPNPTYIQKQLGISKSRTFGWSSQ